MSDSPLPNPDWLHAKLGLKVAGRAVDVDLAVPAGPTTMAELLPALRALTDALVGSAVTRAQDEGRQVSCGAGCGACCRQLVPISQPEAGRIRDLVAEMPAARRDDVRSRFAGALARLEASGLADKLRHPGRFTDDELRPLGLDYFWESIACPFLQDESCSIYAERPLACREYLVTSPCENCARPAAETVACVPVAAKVSTTLTRFDAVPADRFVRWVPLVLALEWADSHENEAPTETGPRLIERFLQSLLGKSFAEACAISTGPERG